MSDNTQGLLVWHFTGQQLRPACMVIKMACHQRHVDIARLPNRLTVIQCLQHGQKAAVLLHGSGQRIQVFGPLMARQARPLRKSRRSGRYRGVDVITAGRGNTAQRLPVRGIAADYRGGRRQWPAPGPVDKKLKAVAVLAQPLLNIICLFSGRTIAHSLEYLFHFVHETFLSHGVMVAGGIAPGNVMLQLTLDVPKQAGRAKAKVTRIQPGVTQLFFNQCQVT